MSPWQPGYHHHTYTLTTMTQDPPPGAQNSVSRRSVLVALVPPAREGGNVAFPGVTPGVPRRATGPRLPRGEALHERGGAWQGRVGARGLPWEASEPRKEPGHPPTLTLWKQTLVAMLEGSCE